MLSTIARSRVLVAFDFDGTLAPIVADRETARMHDSTSALFAEVCELYPCAVISGRGRQDVSDRLGAAPVAYVVGNHGLEPSPRLETFERDMLAARNALEIALTDVAGIDVEDKRYSLALHYRRSKTRRTARATILAAVAALPTRTRVVPGKLVINVLPEHAPNKGDALLALRTTARVEAAVYFGDDQTDEDVFMLHQPGRLWSVRVGKSNTSAATYFLRDQREMDRLLGRLVALRQRRDS